MVNFLDTQKPTQDVQQLFLQATSCHRAGNLAEADRLYREVLVCEPEHFSARHFLGVLCSQQGKPQEALEWIASAMAMRSGDFGVLSSYCSVLMSAQRFEEALQGYDDVLAIKPDDPLALYNRGVALGSLNRYEEALASYNEALVVRPNFVEALYNRGIALWTLKRFEEAVSSYSSALALNPNDARTLNNLGNALQDLHRYDQALANFDQALGIDPNYVEALYNRSNVLNALNRFEDAIESYDRALAIKPDYADAWNNRGNVLQNLKRFDEAIISYEKALSVRSDHPFAFGGAAYCALHLCDWKRSAKFASEVPSHILERNSVIEPLTLLGYSSSNSLQSSCAIKYVDDRVGLGRTPLWDGRIYQHARLRLGYISSDFCEHPVANQLVGLIEAHDRSRFEVFGISLGADDGSQVRQRIAKSCDHFLDVKNRSDRAIAELIRRREIDILVDLNGHTRGARPGILAFRPAPVQVNYLGFAATTGADYIDYVIADPIVAPSEHQAFFKERLVHLPGSFFGALSTAKISKFPTRSDAGLPVNAAVFCCFNSSWKITAPIFAVWMRLLNQCPDSVLWLKDCGQTARTNLRREATARGIEPHRLVFAARVDADAHLARHRLADMFLDTSPYNAHATAGDALRMGLPVVTVLGGSFCGRVAASLLHAAGLGELVAGSLEDYEQLALRLASEREKLIKLKEELASNRATRPLFDEQAFRTHIEAAYQQMREFTRRGEEPRSFSVH